MNNLNELKDDWMEEAVEVINITDTDDKKVYLVNHTSVHEYGWALQRYFKVGNRWEISVDKDGSLLECVRELPYFI